MWKLRIYKDFNVFEPVKFCWDSNTNQLVIRWHKCSCGWGLLFIYTFKMPINFNVSGLLYSFKLLLLWQIKLGETKGWKERFYAEKFEAETKDVCEKIRRHAVRKSTMKFILLEFYFWRICPALCFSLFINISKFWAQCLEKSYIWK